MSSVPDAYSNSAPGSNFGVLPTTPGEPRGTTMSSSSPEMTQCRLLSWISSGRVFAMRMRYAKTLWPFAVTPSQLAIAITRTPSVTCTDAPWCVTMRLFKLRSAARASSNARSSSSTGARNVRLASSLSSSPDSAPAVSAESSVAAQGKSSFLLASRSRAASTGLRCRDEPHSSEVTGGMSSSGWPLRRTALEARSAARYTARASISRWGTRRWLSVNRGGLYFEVLAAPELLVS
mmetsp:Transcript_14294/g.42649  ORF Transcript_14294/g.42649 Transcript_14294/m.42649 type:complete len:235 (-) Transcript_14294:99-803(-)